MIKPKKRNDKEMLAQDKWFSEHKAIRITNAAHGALFGYAGKLQHERKKYVSISEAIENLISKTDKIERG